MDGTVDTQVNFPDSKRFPPSIKAFNTLWITCLSIRYTVEEKLFYS